MSEVFEGLVKVEMLAPQGMLTLRGDLGARAIQRAVHDATGQTMPDTLRANTGDGSGVLWMAPDELALLVPYAQAAATQRRMADALATQHALVCDVSDARAHFRLEGGAVRDVLAKLTPADMARDVMVPGLVRRTRFAQVAAGVWLHDERTAQIFCFRSVADYMGNLLRSAASVGSDVDYH